MKNQKPITTLLIIAMLVSSTALFTLTASAGQPPFSATVEITGTTAIQVGDTTTLTATYTTNRDVTKFEWSIEDVDQGVNNIPDGSEGAGSQTFGFTPTAAGTYIISFSIWHHTQTDRFATQSITITVTDPDPVEYEYETAYAYGGSAAKAFTENGFSNWGWSNGPLAEGTYTFNLYAGAAQCDITKGLKVGTVTVTYSADSLEVTFNVDSPYTLGETHVYADSGMFPLNKDKLTVAPGQYYVNPELSGEIYIIIHAVVGIPI